MTETTTLSTFRSESEVKDFPSNSRNYADIIRFTAGAAPGQDQTNNLALSEQRGNTANAVNGVNFTANYFLVDGIYNNENHQGQGLMVFPEVEALEQYRVETSVPDARFGGAGAAVNVGYKSGTNEFHGDAFYFLRNSALDARKLLRDRGEAGAAQESLRRYSRGTDRRQERQNIFLRLVRGGTHHSGRDVPRQRADRCHEGRRLQRSAPAGQAQHHLRSAHHHAAGRKLLPHAVSRQHHTPGANQSSRAKGDGAVPHRQSAGAFE